VTIAPPAIKSERSNHLRGVVHIHNEGVVEARRVCLAVPVWVGAECIGSDGGAGVLLPTEVTPPLLFSYSYALLVLSVVLSRLFDCRLV